VSDIPSCARFLIPLTGLTILPAVLFGVVGRPGCISAQIMQGYLSDPSPIAPRSDGGRNGAGADRRVRVPIMEPRIPEWEARERENRELLRQRERQLAQLEASRRWAYLGLLVPFALFVTALWAAIAGVNPFARFP
jgi:hypothetical protein